MSEDEVGSEHAKFTDLAQEFTARLRNGVPAHGIPLSSPPRNVGSIRFELTSEGKGDDELEDEALDSNNGNHASQRSREAESLEEHEDDEEDQEHDNSDGMRDGS